MPSFLLFSSPFYHKQVAALGFPAPAPESPLGNRPTLAAVKSAPARRHLLLPGSQPAHAPLLASGDSDQDPARRSIP
jgi:hypothetical protein